MGIPDTADGVGTAVLTDAERGRRMRKVITAAGIGHFVEWFDFGLYGTLATVIAMHFFETGDPQAALLSSFGVFAAGFIMRPIGGLVFGSMGDRIGRRTTLGLVIMVTSGATFVMAILPTYDAIGLAAPLLLVIVRLVQGFAAGGESSGATTLLAEYAPSNRRGFVSSFVDVFGFAAFVAGSGLVLLFTATLGSDALNDWGWRAMFALALPLGLAGLYLRLKLEDTPEFQKIKKAGEITKKPLRTSISRWWKALLFCVGFVVLKAVGHWVLQTFMPSYLQTDLEFDQQTAYGVTTIGLAAIMILVPLFGLLSDRIGRKPVMIIGAGGFIVLTYPALVLMGSGAFLAAVAAMVLLGIFMAAYDGAMSAAMAELFPTNIRYGSMAIAYNISVAAFGGITPWFSQSLIGWTGNTYAPAFYVMGAAVITLLVVIGSKETAKSPLIEKG